MSTGKRRAQHAVRQRQEAEAAAPHKWPTFLRADTEGPVGWHALAALQKVPKNPLRLSLFMRTVTRQIALDMPRAVERISSGSPLNDADRRLGDTIARVSDLIENTRVAFRGGLLEQIPLTDARYTNEVSTLR